MSQDSDVTILDSQASSDATILYTHGQSGSQDLGSQDFTPGARTYGVLDCKAFLI